MNRVLYRLTLFILENIISHEQMPVAICIHSIPIPKTYPYPVFHFCGELTNVILNTEYQLANTIIVIVISTCNPASTFFSYSSA